jgi:thiol-disulfide isomerase/thioredoxin
MVKLFISDSCPVCQDMKEQIAALVKEGNDVQVVSIDTEEGFDAFAKEVLDKSADGEGAIPTAYEGGEKCQILRGANKMAIKCGGKLIGAVPDEVED